MRYLILFAIFLCGHYSFAAESQTVFPAESWLQYESPALQGWSPDALEEARQFAKESGVAAYMVVERGYVVAAWGDTARRYKSHSMRKSFLSALFGINVGRGLIDPNATLQELGIDDVHKLTANEKTATVFALLKARSGVYHPAAYETAAMKRRRPARGEFAPGSHYYYNNWDFNALGGIFEQATGVDVHSAFARDIAAIIGMQDFRMQDTNYYFEENASRFPAYILRTSTRDAARFGLLYLASGRWGEQQIVPVDWVRKTSEPFSTSVRSSRGYGLLWWVSEDPLFAELGMYHAAGVGGQVIAVLPGKDLVIVQRVDTYRGDAVNNSTTLALMRKVVAAKRHEIDGPVIAHPMKTNGAVFAAPTAAMMNDLAGRFANDSGDLIADVSIERGPVLRIDYSGRETVRGLQGAHRFREGQQFLIVEGADKQLYIEDTGFPLQLARDDAGRIQSVTIVRPNVPLTLSRINASPD